jgi:hypothetical protein
MEKSGGNAGRATRAPHIARNLIYAKPRVRLHQNAQKLYIHQFDFAKTRNLCYILAAPP